MLTGSVVISPDVLEPDALLAPSPARASDILIGYARISTRGQNIEPQLDQLAAAGCRRVFTDTKTGKTAARPELKAADAFLHAALGRGYGRHKWKEATTVGADDKIENTAEGAKGKAKEAYGDATDDESTQAEGKADQSKADLKQAGEKAKDAFK